MSAIFEAVSVFLGIIPALIQGFLGLFGMFFGF